jgi:hypothetical protein
MAHLVYNFGALAHWRKYLAPFAQFIQALSLLAKYIIRYAISRLINDMSLIM